MILRFKTKTDRNGNTYHLIIDTNNQTYSTEIRTMADFEAVVIGKTDRHNMITTLKENGYIYADAI